MHRFALGWIELTMRDAGARTHSLNLAGTDDGTGTHAVLVFKRTFKNVGDDFHVTVRVCPESFTWSYTIFVNNAQRSESHVVRVVILVEGKRVIRVQPPVIKMT